MITATLILLTLTLLLITFEVAFMWSDKYSKLRFVALYFIFTLIAINITLCTIGIIQSLC
jgi:hypothetical protein